VYLGDWTFLHRTNSGHQVSLVPSV
jgi:hypothetical protein